MPGEALPEKLPAALSRYDLPLFEIGGTPVTVVTLVAAALVITVTYAFSLLLRRIAGRALRKKSGNEGEVRAVLRILHYAVMAVGVSIALSTSGINLGALFAAGAVFAVAVGFAMQNIAQNFVSGVILLVERVIKPGDVLEVEGAMVKVEHIGLRTTIAKTLDDEELVIPNATIVQNTVKNYTLRDPHYRVRVRVGVAYGSDMELVKRTLESVAGPVEWRCPEPEPRILLVEFGASSVDWEVSVWTEDPWRVKQWRSDLHLRIWRALAAQGITIAFPQLDVHLDAELRAALSRRDVADRRAEVEP